MPVHTSPDGEVEKMTERGRATGGWRKTKGKADIEEISSYTHQPGQKSCIGLCRLEAEERILTFPLLQATLDSRSLPPDWRLAAAGQDKQDGERKRGMERERRMTIDEKCEFVLCNVTTLGN